MIMGGIPLPKTGVTHYYAQYQTQLGLPDNGSAITGLVVCNGWDLELFGPAKRSGPRLVSTVTGYEVLCKYQYKYVK